MGKTANTIQSADRKIDQLHKAGNTIRDHLSALRQDLASADVCAFFFAPVELPNNPNICSKYPHSIKQETLPSTW